MAHLTMMQAHEGAVFEVCLFKKNKEGVLYLLLLRSEDDPLYPSIWQVVTGTREGGEHTISAALREVREETGLQVENFWVVPHVNSFYVARTDRVLVSPFFACSVNAASEPRLSPEHRAYRWVGLKEACELIPWPTQRLGVEVVDRFIAHESEGGRLLRVNLEEFDERRHR
jgi:8-oxo-dGTP pyrophosphatase MutT (NUDIX family)